MLGDCLGDWRAHQDQEGHTDQVQGEQSNPWGISRASLRFGMIEVSVDAMFPFNYSRKLRSNLLYSDIIFSSSVLQKGDTFFRPTLANSIDRAVAEVPRRQKLGFPPGGYQKCLLISLELVRI